MIPGKNRASILLSLAAAVAISLASCASKPAAPPPEPAPAPVVQPASAPQSVPAVSQEELDRLLAEARELKKRAFDLQVFEVLPDDYRAANDSFATAVASYDAKDAVAAKEGLAKTTALYKDLIARGVIALAEAKRKTAEEMRDTALKAGADSKAPGRFDPAAELFAAAAALADSSRHEESLAGFERARQAWELAYKRSLAGDLRERIAERGYATWDSGNFQLAEGKYAAEESLWASGADADRAAGVDAINEAVLRFNLVIQKGSQTVAIGSRDASDQAKARSLDIKADVAAKELFQQASAGHDEGVSKLAAGEYETAYGLFSESQTVFDEATALAAEKRARAVEAMDAAAAAAAESERKAQEADALVNRTSP